MAASLSLENQQYLIELVPCLCQIRPNAKFSKCALGISEKDIYLYSDMQPSRNTGDVFYYSAFATLPLNNIVTLVKSDIRNNEELKKYIRVDIFCKDMDQCKILYFLKSDKTKFIKLLKTAKKAKIDIVDNALNYRLGSC